MTSQPLTTTLFFVLYHLASYEAGSKDLMSCGMMEIQEIQWPSAKSEHITFVTRTSYTGLNSFISRLDNILQTNIKTHGDLVARATPLSPPLTTPGLQSCTAPMSFLTHVGSLGPGVSQSAVPSHNSSLPCSPQHQLTASHCIACGM